MPDDMTYPLPDEVLLTGADDNDVSLSPSATSDAPKEIAQYIGEEVRKRYDVYSYRHAAAILRTAFPSELDEIEKALLGFTITKKDIAMPGGNESTIPKLFSSALRPQGWKEARIQADLVVRVIEKADSADDKKSAETARTPTILKNYIDGHKIDYVKGQVALDLEWNSKDQTFDRDLFAFRMFHECGVVSAAVLITRSEKLNPLFETLELLKKDGTIDCGADGKPKLCKQKYGASTTWMGKLLYRLNAGRHGGCPVLVFGITPAAISDLESVEAAL